MADHIAVIRFPGSLDHEAAVRVLHEAGAEATLVSHHDHELPAGTTGVVLPGGFSYGDHLRCGAIASRTPIMDAVRAFAEGGGPVLGICNGFQILCESGLLPGALLSNDTQSFICKQVALEVVDADTRWTGDCVTGSEISIPIKHHDGAWQGDPSEGRVLFRYADGNPNGARDAIAGIANRAGNVMGLMPHPEMACEALLGSADGRIVMAGVLAAGVAA
jgi:phosphoribosylformylglycinamidine synthase I